MIIIGGGLAGLISAIHLAQAGITVSVIEKKAYPFHKVCGEYISNEVLPYLQSLQINMDALNPAHIQQFLLSSPSGEILTAPLDLGGFGISRYTLDHYLAQFARQHGVTIHEKTHAQRVIFKDDIFTVSLSDGSQQQAAVVLGSYGKRSHLDRQFNRSFFNRSSPYIGVKYHLKTDFPRDLIALHNFKDGYAGISAIEENKYCFCYLTTRANLKKYGDIKNMETNLLSQNPHLRKIFHEAAFLYPQPEVINEISFAPKSCVENHMLMAGDAAGMITPLCGNGMAMAIHGAKLLSEQVIKYCRGQQTRAELEAGYTKVWQNQFGRRLQVGRVVQGLFGRPLLTEMVLHTFKRLPAGVRFLMKQTHGQPF